jgi:hypothetical protein
MREKKAWKEKYGDIREEDVICRLERMFEDSKLLCQQDDPILQGQMQVILGLLADILEAKDPERYFRHVVEYE